MTAESGNRVHIERAGVVRMALPAADAFPLFNAEGERRWVAGWVPCYLYRAGSDSYMGHWEEAIQRHVVEGVPLAGE